jgi:hypothetical protein
MTTTTEIVLSEPPQLAKAIQSSSLAAADANTLREAFGPFFEKAANELAASRAITVTDPTQVTEIKKSRTARLQLREIRIAAEKTRKVLKEDSLRKGKAIDGIYNVLVLDIEPEERRLEEQEKIAERMEAERKAKIAAERTEALRPFADPTHYMLGHMAQPAFDALLAGAKAAHEAKIEADRKAAEQAAAAEQARRDEDARVRAENERLRKEAAEREAAAKAERERLEAERREVERKAREEREAAERKAKAEREQIETAARRQREEAEAKARAEREASEAKARKEREEQEKRHKAELARKTKIAASGERLFAAVNKAARSATIRETSVTVNRAEWDALIAIVQEVGGE